MPRFILTRTLETLADGVVWGVVLAVVAGGVLYATRRRPPIAGYLVAAGFLIVVGERFPAMALVGVLALLLPAFTEHRSMGAVVGFVAALPGAALIAFSATTGSPWRAVLVALAIAAGGALATDFARTHDGRGLAAIFLTIATTGAWLEIPDVDRILVLLGVALPLLLLSWPQVLVHVGGSAHVWVAILMWTAVDSGATRPASIAGTAATLGFLLVEPVVRRLVGFREGVFTVIWNTTPRPWDITAAVFAQGGLALLVARVAGVRDGTAVAIAISVVLLGMAAGGLYAATRHADLY